MLVNINFWLAKMFYKKKDLLEKAAKIKKFEYSPWGKQLKAQTDIAKNNIKPQIKSVKLITQQVKNQQSITMLNQIWYMTVIIVI